MDSFDFKMRKPEQVRQSVMTKLKTHHGWSIYLGCASTVRWAVGAPTAPYFRFPALRQPPETYGLSRQRNIGIFSADMYSMLPTIDMPEALATMSF
jgi:hypothetical protein